MKKIYITGGDNCYCCECGGLCDRTVMEIDTERKTLKYIDGRGLCLGKHCWRHYTCEDGTELEREYTGKVRAYRNGVEIPCVVKNNKWGKDGEFGNWGICRKLGGEFVLVSYETYTSENPERTGWRFERGE